MRPATIAAFIVLQLHGSVFAARTGPGGINSDVTGLTGAGIAIGQVEESRPSKDGLDAAAFSNPHVSPAFVYSGLSPIPAASGQGVTSLVDGQHATAVAAILNGSAASGAQYRGVAPDAQLHATSEDGGDSGITLSLQLIATRLLQPNIDGDRVRAVNYSAGKRINELVFNLDGQFPVTAFVDWSSSVHDVTYVVAWPGFFADIPSIPSDNFNGITLAAAGVSLQGPPGVYRQFRLQYANPETQDSDAAGPRTSIDIMAPGEDLPSLNWLEEDVPREGGSFATPHVTGAVALLQQYAKGRVQLGNPAFHPVTSRRHQVMKAVILNSADKLDGVHGSSRTVIDDEFNDFTQSEAMLPEIAPR
ncbi:MAG: S8 family serine peptidase [Lacipirellulaceae bacterium]